MIQVCDCIMGSGKTQSTIRYIQEHPDKKIVYVTPYLDEARRINNACPDAQFVEPSKEIPKYHFRKSEHLAALLKEGRNVASTHELFLNFKGDILKYAAAGNYELIIDEAVDTIQSCNISKGDVELIKQLGWINEDGTRNADCTNTYAGGKLGEFYALFKNGNLIEADKRGEAYYWMLTKEVFDAFENIKVLTYLFDAQILKYYFDLTGIEYERIGIEHPDADTYRFTSSRGYIPEYVGTLSSKIHIFDNKKLNAVGDDNFALSCSWYSKQQRNGKANFDRLRKNVTNYFNNYMSMYGMEYRLWSVWTDYRNLLRCKGFKYNDLAFNSKATNDYKNKKVLAYCVNVFMNPNEKGYLLSKGINVLEDEYALSVMIQWIWRSAIRDGEEIWIYIPSKRMRNLLSGWIERVEREYAEYQKERMEVTND